MTTTEIIDNWLGETKDSLIENHDKLGLRASGNWANSLMPESKVEPGKKITATIYGAKYTGAIEFGRRLNRNQSPEAIMKWVGWAGSTFIRQWCNDKGISTTASYAIAYKIAKHGWVVPTPFNAGGLVSDVVTDVRIKELIKRLSSYYLDSIKTDMVNTLQYGNNYNTIP